MYVPFSTPLWPSETSVENRRKRVYFPSPFPAGRAPYPRLSLLRWRTSRYFSHNHDRPTWTSSRDSTLGTSCTEGRFWYCRYLTRRLRSRGTYLPSSSRPSVSRESENEPEKKSRVSWVEPDGLPQVPQRILEPRGEDRYHSLPPLLRHKGSDLPLEVYSQTQLFVGKEVGVPNL